MVLQLGFIGCRGISRAHFGDLVEPRQAGLKRFELRAVCDVDVSHASAVAVGAA
jgi:hypothetical protein